MLRAGAFEACSAVAKRFGKKTATTQIAGARAKVHMRGRERWVQTSSTPSVRPAAISYTSPSTFDRSFR
ncbi:MAG: hypothetical protein ABSC94_04545 [Polyangiaceae bacterium]|jgi:hypothetical protein